ncbi:MAG TPA: S41 family peptidase, partial [Kofleriaceae bacterium]|nr:S41 family peptidase [Kofleriaceae bacterium]
MGKLRLRIAAPLALLSLFVAPAAEAQQRAAPDRAAVRRAARAQRTRAANGAAYRAARQRLLARGRGFVRSHASRWIPAAKLRDIPATGGMRTRAFRRARLMSFYIPETRNGVAGFRVERLYGMSDREAPETPELGAGGNEKVAAAYNKAVATLVDQHISEPKPQRLHWKAIRELEKVRDATDPVATGRKGIEAAATGFDRWTRYNSPEGHRATQTRRNRPPSESVTTRYTRDRLAVVRLSGFTRGIAAEIRGELAWEMPRGIVLDLRGNGGGLTDESRELLETFAPDSRLLSRRTVRKGGRIESIEWRATQRGPLAGIPLFVLVDGKSASASETVTSSLKDNGLARIGGARTFGKGVGQQTTDLDDGGSVAVTLTTIQGPTSTYHGVGLDPDVPAADLEARARTTPL